MTHEQLNEIMGYGIMPYRVKTAAIVALFGSQKEALATTLQRGLENLDDSFEPDYGWESAHVLLTNYLQGNEAFFAEQDNTAKHWYCLELLIANEGKMLSNGEWYPSRDIDVFYDGKEFRMYSFDRDGKLNLDGPDDFPCVFTVYHEDLEAAGAHAESIADDAARKQYLGWISEAQRHKDDLLLFYY